MKFGGLVISAVRFASREAYYTENGRRGKSIGTRIPVAKVAFAMGNKLLRGGFERTTNTIHIWCGV